MTPEQQQAIAAATARLHAGGSGPLPATGAPAAPQTFQRAGGYGAGSAGVNEAVIKATLGLKQLIGLGTPEDQAVLREIELEQQADPQQGLRTTGNIAGNMVLTALPAGGLAKSIQAVKGLGRAAPLLAAAGSAAGVEGAIAPVEGDGYGEVLLNKSKEAAKAAAMGGAFHAGTSALAKPITGLFKAKPEAAALYKEGINPTLQQGAAGAPGQFIGGLTAGMQNLRTRLNDEGAEAILKRATEGKVSMREGTGEEFAQAARKYVGDQYDNLWAGKRIQLSPRQREALVSVAGKLPPDGRGAKAAAEAADIVADLFGVEGGKSIARTNFPLNPQTWRQEFRNKLTQAAMGSDDAVKARLLSVRDVADDTITLKNLTPAEKVRRLEVDKLNFDATRLEEAVSGGKQATEGIDISRLNRAYSKMLKQGRSIGNTTYDEIVAPMARVADATPNQNTARSAWAAARKVAGLGAVGAVAGGGPGMAAILAPAAIVSAAGQTGVGARHLLGQENWQKSLADLLRRGQSSASGAAGSTFTAQE